MNVNSTVFHYRGGVIMMNVVLRQVSLRMRKTKHNTVAPGGKTTFRNMYTCTEKARDETLLFSSDTNSKKRCFTQTHTDSCGQQEHMAALITLLSSLLG